MAEAQTLTYDANEQPEGEFSAEEQEALEVGEKLAEQQEQLLAGKFRDAEELEKGYIELQKKLGGSEEEEATEPEEPEVEESQDEDEEEERVDTSFLDTLWEQAKADKYTEETLEQLRSLPNEQLASMALQQRAELEAQIEDAPVLTEENVTDLKKIPGSERDYQDMISWATETLTEREIEMYDAVMDQGNPLAAFFAVQALTYRFNDARGVDGEMLQGKASTNSGSQFRSQAEVVRAMSDPKYDNDPAYRQDIYDKLERSNIQF